MAEKNPASAQKPTVGRIVHVGYLEKGALVPCAALVALVHEDGTTVNAAVVLPSAITVGSSHIPHSAELRDGCWSWPAR